VFTNNAGALAAYDGTTDYSGSSGNTVTASFSDSRDRTLATANDLALFTGIGTIGLPLGAGITGGTNQVAAQILTGSIATTLTLTYTYTPSATPVPEPASLSLVGLGLAGLGARRWRQNSQRIRS
jgi:hypothetical protein